jgi:hypothetical protein
MTKTAGHKSSSSSRKFFSVTHVIPVSTPSSEYIQRSDSRVRCSLPVCVRGSTGLTRDISASGIFFEINDPIKNLGSTFTFSIELSTPGGPLKMICTGEVVRLEKRRGKLGIAARITNQAMQSL